MKKAVVNSWVLLGLTAFAGCGTPPVPAEPDATAEAARIRAKFDEVGDAFVAESDPERAADIYLSVHTQDALLMVPGAPAVEGHTGIRPFIVEFVKNYEFRFPDWTSEELLVSGDLAVHRFSGIALMISRETGDTIAEDRKYLDVWRKEADGKWRVARHMFNKNN